MFKLLFAIILAFALWPVDENNQPVRATGFDVSTSDVIGAAHSVYEDIGSFCERNVETCVTGKELVHAASAEIQSRLQASAVNAVTSNNAPSANN